MRASPMSGLLSATMISSEGTQFGLDFLVVQVHQRDFHPAQLVGETKPVHAGEFRRFAERKSPHLEKADGQLKGKLFLNGLARFAAGDQQVVRVLHG